MLDELALSVYFNPEFAFLKLKGNIKPFVEFDVRGLFLGTVFRHEVLRRNHLPENSPY